MGRSKETFIEEDLGYSEVPTKDSKESSSKLEQVKDKILDLLNNKLEGGANIDYLVGLAKVYRDLK